VGKDTEEADDGVVDVAVVGAHQAQAVEVGPPEYIHIYICIYIYLNDLHGA
jgi:hypothetical protein